MCAIRSIRSRRVSILDPAPVRSSIILVSRSRWSDRPLLLLLSDWCRTYSTNHLTLLSISDLSPWPSRMPRKCPTDQRSVASGASYGSEFVYNVIWIRRVSASPHRDCGKSSRHHQSTRVILGFWTAYSCYVTEYIRTKVRATSITGHETNPHEILFHSSAIINALKCYIYWLSYSLGDSVRVEYSRGRPPELLLLHKSSWSATIKNDQKRSRAIKSDPLVFEL